MFYFYTHYSKPITNIGIVTATGTGAGIITTTISIPNISKLTMNINDSSHNDYLGLIDDVDIDRKSRVIDYDDGISIMSNDLFWNIRFSCHFTGITVWENSNTFIRPIRTISIYTQGPSRRNPARVLLLYVVSNNITPLPVNGSIEPPP